MGLQQVPPLGELGEQQRPIARLDHLLEDFLQALQLGAAAGEAGLHPLFLQGQGRVVADLLQSGEQGQHLAMLLAQRCPRDRIQAFVNSSVVELLLLGAQTHPFPQFHLFRQVRDDRAIGLQATQDEGPHPGLEIPQR